MDVAAWETQLRKGAIELAVLAAAARGEKYGLALLAEINGAGELVSDGALYPLLSRLERDGKLASRWANDEGAAHPRKYYRLTEDGRRTLKAMRPRWQQFSGAISALVGDDE